MHAAKVNQNRSSVRNQLLSSDIGNIDVRDEKPVIQQQQQSYVQPGYNMNYQQPYQQQQVLPQQQFYPQQRFPPAGPTRPSQNMQHQQYQPPGSQQPMRPFSQQGGSGSRRSSMTSQHSNFNQNFNNFFGFGKTKKSGGGGGDGDDGDDDDEKDIMIDATGSTMSFDDISTLRDRGRYGGGATFDTAPIIPTLAASTSRPSSNVSNVQYRKQMFAMKKQAMKGVKQDPRAMSLQSRSGNPYIEQGTGPMHFGSPPNDPRSQSFTGQTPPFNSRANSLTNPPRNMPQSARAYSLTTNPYQRQHQAYAAGPQQFQQRSQLLPQQGGYPSQQNGKFPQPQGPALNQQRAAPQQQGYPHPPQKRLSVPSVSSPLHNSYNVQPPQQQKPYIHHQQQQQSPVPQGVTQSHQQPFSQSQVSLSNPGAQLSTSNLRSGNSSTPTIEENKSAEAYDDNHHYLADKFAGNNDTIGSYSDVSKEQSYTLPNGQSTPSPEHSDKSANHDDGDAELSPSKLPRSKALPHLSLLSIRDDTDETNGYQKPKDENERELSASFEEDLNDQENAVIAQGFFGKRLQNHTKLSPTKVSTSKNQASPSPLKKQVLQDRGHKQFPQNSNSISSMSAYSTVSGASDNNAEPSDNSKKLYQLASESETNNNVFVTASQFSLMDDHGNHRKTNSLSSNFSSVDGNGNFDRTSVVYDTIAENASVLTATPKHLDGDDSDKTPTIEQHHETFTPSTVAKRLSADDNSLRSSNGSLKGSFKSPKFFKNWSKKRREKKEINSFEPVGKPIHPQTQNHVNGERNNNSGLNIITRGSNNDPQNEETVSYEMRVNPQNVFIEEDDDHERQFQEVDYHNKEISTPATTAPSTSNSNEKELDLGESFLPEKSSGKKLGLTIDQLAIMQENTSLLEELDLVSRELASSIKRELKYENLDTESDPAHAEVTGTELDKSLEICKLIEKLNEERKKRCIAEEHVLLMENGTKPSLLELNYENERLRLELASKDDLINKQAMEIESLQKDTPALKKEIAGLSKIKKEFESITIPSLQNKIEFLTNDNKKLNILAERIKILKNEKVELERKISETVESNDFSFVNSSHPNDGIMTENDHSMRSQSDASSPQSKQMKKMDGDGSFTEWKPPSSRSPLRMKKLASFNLISVTSAHED